MSFLTTLAARTLGLADLLDPVMPSRFESVADPVAPAIVEDVAERESARPHRPAGDPGPVDVRDGPTSTAARDRRPVPPIDGPPPDRSLPPRSRADEVQAETGRDAPLVAGPVRFDAWDRWDEEDASPDPDGPASPVPGAPVSRRRPVDLPGPPEPRRRRVDPGPGPARRELVPAGPAPASAEPPPATVVVRIGRVDVRAVRSAPAAPPAPPPGRRPSAPSLSDHLRARDEGRR